MTLIRAKTKNQKEYIRTIIENDITLCTGPAGCVDGDTEFYSENGWKKIKDYKRTDKVLQFNNDIGFAQFVWPLNYINEPCEEFFHFKSANCDQMLTREHNVVWETGAGVLHKERLESIENFAGKTIPNTFLYNDSPHVFTDHADGEISRIIESLMVFDTGAVKNDVLKNSEESIVSARNAVDYLQFIGVECEIKKVKKTLQIIPSKKTFGDFFPNTSWFAEKFVKAFREYVGENETVYEFLNKDNAEFFQWACITSGTSCTLDYVDNGVIRARWNAQRAEFPQPEFVKVKDGRKYCFEVDSGLLILRRNGKVFLTGNSGKDYVALGIALEHIAKDNYPQNRLYITRPMVSTGRRDFPYIKGDLGEKCKPYFAPIIQNLSDILGDEKHVNRMIENKQIVIQPLELMRGYTFTNSYVVMSEMQNSTIEQIVMAITRIGENTKMILNGDIHQKDIEEKDGLFYLWEKLVKTKSDLVGSVKLDYHDIQRNPIIGKILKELNWDKSI